MYRKKFLRRLIVAGVMVGTFNVYGVTVVPTAENFIAPYAQCRVAYAAIQTYEGKGVARFDFGEGDPDMIKKAQAYAQSRAIQAAKEKAGVYIKNQTTVLNAAVTEDSIYTMTNTIVDVMNVDYKSLPAEMDGDVGIRYEATVTVTIDTDEIKNYLRQNAQQRETLENANRELKKSIADNNREFENLEKRSATAKTVEEQNEIKAALNNAYNELLSNQKIEEGWKTWQKAGIMNFNSALPFFNEAVELDPQNANAYITRANTRFMYYLYTDNEHYDEIIADYTKAIQINPNYADAYDGRGFVYYWGGQYDKALADYTKAIQIAPNDSNSAGSYCGRGIIYYHNFKQTDKALADYTKAIQVNPNYAKAYLRRGEVYALDVQYDKAIADLTKAIQLDPKLTEAYKYRLLCYLGEGDQAKADADRAKIKELGG